MVGEIAGNLLSGSKEMKCGILLLKYSPSQFSLGYTNKINANYLGISRICFYHLEFLIIHRTKTAPTNMKARLGNYLLVLSKHNQDQDRLFPYSAFSKPPS